MSGRRTMPGYYKGRKYLLILFGGWTRPTLNRCPLTFGQA
jgi:hypothetical protein